MKSIEDILLSSRWLTKSNDEWLFNDEYEVDDMDEVIKALKQGISTDKKALLEAIIVDIESLVVLQGPEIRATDALRLIHNRLGKEDRIG